MDWRIWDMFLRSILFRMENGLTLDQQAFDHLLDWNTGCRECHDIFYSEICDCDLNTIPYCEGHRLDPRWWEGVDIGCPDCRAIELNRERIKKNAASKWLDHLLADHTRKLHWAFQEWKAQMEEERD